MAQPQIVAVAPVVLVAREFHAREELRAGV
jgi:hypothetical protein